MKGYGAFRVCWSVEMTPGLITYSYKDKKRIIYSETSVDEIKMFMVRHKIPFFDGVSEKFLGEISESQREEYVEVGELERSLSTAKK